MHFLPDVYVPCDVCRGRRYNRETLDVYYKGKNIADVLDMTVEDALDFFDAVPRLKHQAADATRGRSRLYPSRAVRDDAVRGRSPAREARDRALEAGHGQHAVHPRRADYRPPFRGRAGSCSKSCTSSWIGETRSVVIEHNLHVVKTADWVIDLGPEGGDPAGGRILVEGTPETVAATAASHTGKHLAPLLTISLGGVGIRNGAVTTAVQRQKTNYLSVRGKQARFPAAP